MQTIIDLIPQIINQLTFQITNLTNQIISQTNSMISEVATSQEYPNNVSQSINKQAITSSMSNLINNISATGGTVILSHYSGTIFWE